MYPCFRGKIFLLTETEMFHHIQKSSFVYFLLFYLRIYFFFYFYSFFIVLLFLFFYFITTSQNTVIQYVTNNRQITKKNSLARSPHSIKPITVASIRKHCYIVSNVSLYVHLYGKHGSARMFPDSFIISIGQFTLHILFLAGSRC